MGAPDGVFEGAAAIVVVLGGAALIVVLNALHGTIAPRRHFRQKGAAIALVPGQILGNMAKLSGIVLVNEQNVHDAPFALDPKRGAGFQPAGRVCPGRLEACSTFRTDAVESSLASEG